MAGSCFVALVSKAFSLIPHKTLIPKDFYLVVSILSRFRSKFTGFIPSLSQLVPKLWVDLYPSQYIFILKYSHSTHEQMSIILWNKLVE